MTTRDQPQMAPSFFRLTLHQWSLVVTGMALLLRLVGVGEHSYWFDEAREVLRAQTPWPEILHLTQGADPPVYRLLLFPIAQWTVDEFWLRLPSVLSGAAAVYLVYRWLAMLGFPWVGLGTAVLLAVLPVLLFYAQEVSQYSLTVFLAALLLLAYERAGEYGRGRDWILLTLASLLAIYTYYGLALLLPPLELDLAWRTWKQRSRRRVLGLISYHLAVSLGVVALYFSLLKLQIARVSANKGLTPVFAEPGILASLRRLDDLLLDHFVRFFITPISTDLPQFIIYLFASLVLIGYGWLFWRSAQGRRIVLITLGTGVVMYVAYGMGLYPFGERYGLFLIPLWAAALAAVVRALSRWRWAAGLLFLGLVLFFLHLMPFVPETWNPWVSWPREELRPTVAYLNAHAEPDDVVYVYYGAVPAYQVYQPQELYTTTFGSWFRTWPVADKLAEIQDVVAGSTRFWLVMTHIFPGEDTELLTALSQGDPAYVPNSQYTDMNAAVILLQRVE